MEVEHGNRPMLKYLAENITEENVASFVESSPTLDKFKNDKKSTLSQLVAIVKEFIMSLFRDGVPGAKTGQVKVVDPTLDVYRGRTQAIGIWVTGA